MLISNTFGVTGELCPFMKGKNVQLGLSGFGYVCCACPKKRKGGERRKGKFIRSNKKEMKQ